MPTGAHGPITDYADEQAHHGGYENSSTLKSCKPVKNSEKKLKVKVKVEGPSYNVKIAEILCWKGQDKPLKLEFKLTFKLTSKKQTNKIIQTRIRKLSVT